MVPALAFKKHKKAWKPIKLSEIQTHLIESVMLIPPLSRRTTHHNGFPSCCHSVDAVACMAPSQTAQTHTLHSILLHGSLT